MLQVLAKDVSKCNECVYSTVEHASIDPLKNVLVVILSCKVGSIISQYIIIPSSKHFCCM